MPFTASSTWTWVDHPVSGLHTLTNDALLTLGFPLAPHLRCLTLPVNVTRRTVLQKVRGCTQGTSTACKHRVSGSLSLPSRGSFHLSFTVLYAIGHWGVFSLTGWSPLIHTKFHVLRATLDSAAPFRIRVRGFHPLWPAFPKLFHFPTGHLCSPNPGTHALRFGLFPFRSPLLRKSIFLSLPPAT